MDLLAQFLAICVLGILLYSAYLIYIKAENLIKKYYKILLVVLIICYMLFGIGCLIIDNLEIENIFVDICMACGGIFSFYLTWCLIFGKMDKNKDKET